MPSATRNTPPSARSHGASMPIAARPSAPHVAKIASATAAPKPDARPERVPSARLRRMTMMLTGPTGAASARPMMNPRTKSMTRLLSGEGAPPGIEDHALVLPPGLRDLGAARRSGRATARAADGGPIFLSHARDGSHGSSAL